MSENNNVAMVPLSNTLNSSALRGCNSSKPTSLVRRAQNCIMIKCFIAN